MKLAKRVETKKVTYWEEHKLLCVFLCAVGFRLISYMLSAIMMMFQAGDGSSFGLEAFLQNWVRWDAQHYVNIATNGYSGAIENGQHLFLVFFPLYPYLMKLVALFVGNVKLSGILISTLAYAGGCVYLYRLMIREYSETAAEYAVILISLFPFGFFFGGLMSESVFFLVSAAMLYYIAEHKWWKAVCWGAFATLARVHGILLVVPALLELWVVFRPDKLLLNKQYKKLWSFVGRCASFGFMFIGTGIYLLINYVVEGDPFRFMYYQKNHWYNGVQWPWKTLKCIWDYCFAPGGDLQNKMAIWIPEGVLFIVCMILLIWGVKKIRPMYYGYAVVYILITYSAAWLISGARYLACNIPLFMILAVGGEKHKRFLPVLSVVFAMLQMIYLFAFMQGRQIL